MDIQAIILILMKKKAVQILQGKVIKGSGDGKKLGFPTANIKLESELDLTYGVYATEIEIEGTIYPSVTHYGPRLVFNETNPQLEVHILDFDELIYDKTVTVTIYKMIRSTEDFESLDSLKARIELDCKEAKKLLN